MSDTKAKTYTPAQLKKILAAHAKWRLGDPDGDRADLYGADLGGANLGGANLETSVLPAFQILPQEGEFVGWKKVWTQEGHAAIILKLEICSDASRVCTPFGRKCRASSVRVLAAFDMQGKEVSGTFVSVHDSNFTYEVGAVVTPKDGTFNSDIRVECTPGIHFFITRAEAEAY